ncbi:MAG: glycosyltransferase family 8 protein [Candidatus Limimorpha sp.]
MRTAIPVFFTIDESYAPLAAVAIRSIACHADKTREYQIYILHQSLSQLSQELITRQLKDNMHITFRSMPDCIDGIDDVIGNRLRADYFTLTIYFRLFIPTMFPEYDKVIYLDSDVVIPGDISRLYDMPLGDNLIAACPDWSIQDIAPLRYYIEEGFGFPPETYVNSGVLLMNTRLLRECHLETRFLDMLNTYHVDCIAPDQDYLNALCHGRILYLGHEWDAMPDKKGELPNPQIIHYNLFEKPWQREGIAYADYFWKYADMAGLGDYFRKYLADYTDKQRQQDDESMARLLHRGEEIPTNKLTFKTLFETGKEKRL